MAEETTIILGQERQVMQAERSRSFAGLLREHRRAAGMTQEELAERSGISPRALRKLESGASQVPRRDTVQLLARALNLGEPERLVLQDSVQRRAPVHGRLPYTPFPLTDRRLEAEALLDLTVQLARAVPLPYAGVLALLVHGDLMAASDDWEEARVRHEAALAILGHLRKRIIAADVDRAVKRRSEP
jgi:transcriptional regulator with XRE-family HTH domain